MARREPLTFVTVVFEPEVPLLRLQARSLQRFLDPASAAELLVLDNCAGGMSRRSRRRILGELGPTLAARTEILRTEDLGVDRGARGWRSQQAAKLLISRRIRTAHSVVLDAKNHLIGPARLADFVDDEGRARGGTHSYEAHPLREGLERTLRYLGADDAAVARQRADFPRTVTPFVLDTAIVRRMLDDVERTSGRPFAEEFERARLLEFFLYSGWSILKGDGVPVDGTRIDAPIVWPRLATLEGVEGVIAEARAHGSSWFAVHRRVLARADARGRRRLEELWVASDLMAPAEAARFTRRFRLGYAPAVARARLGERLARLQGG
ncbi:DUF6492 family protein [Agrococcus sp. HG114]|uniref:DUF6492 family protein n=1 Tax=Agrococcus sp. HG114 TaxID=2969757 RepID=UPI00215B6BE9|nr:DUF6492 family protein [Agrococcus sp. HG114]MCR8670846.1 DUF6492 family protein [Agrococcus sp. HG114]